jgi:hypothetical protein
VENVEASTSHNPMGLHGDYRESFSFLPKTSRYILNKNVPKEHI